MEAQSPPPTSLADLLHKAHLNGYTNKYVIVDRHTIRDELSDQSVNSCQVMIEKKCQLTESTGISYWFCLVNCRTGKKGWMLYPDNGPQAAFAPGFGLNSGLIPDILE